MNSPQEWTEEDLFQLIALKQEESLQLEFKRAESLDATDQRKKTEISKDVSAFANSAGGTIVYGIAESSQQPSYAESFSPIDPVKYSKEWLEHVIHSRIQPRIHGTVIHPIELRKNNPGQYVYVVSIPQSETAHQASDNRYYKRYNFQSVAMEDYEVRQTMSRTARAAYRSKLEVSQVSQRAEFSLVDDVAEKNVTVEAARAGGSQFTLEAKRIGKFKLTMGARMKGGANRADIVVREIEVIPNGREQSVVSNGRLETTAQHEVAFPAESIPEASKIFVRLYPGPLSQVIEGMDSLLRMPYGCFEQTSSSTYPNVLALDYMKRTKKLTPEVHAKAEGFIANGYQRLLTFEVPSGGFSWFGNAPANKILTAYGLMEFSAAGPTQPFSLAPLLGLPQVQPHEVGLQRRSEISNQIAMSPGVTKRNQARASSRN